MRHVVLSLVLSLAALALPAHASAQDFRATVTSQLDAAARPVTSAGFKNDPSVFSRDVMVGMLSRGTSAFVELSLTGGARYFIAAACDQDCDDMDLRLFSVDSTTPVAEDKKDDDYPMMNFVAPKTGRYMLAIDMVKCGEGDASTSMCYYGYQVYRK